MGVEQNTIHTVDKDRSQIFIILTKSILTAKSIFVSKSNSFTEFLQMWDFNFLLKACNFIINTRYRYSRKFRDTTANTVPCQRPLSIKRIQNTKINSTYTILFSSRMGADASTSNWSSSDDTSDEQDNEHDEEIIALGMCTNIEGLTLS